LLYRTGPPPVSSLFPSPFAAGRLLEPGVVSLHFVAFFDLIPPPFVKLGGPLRVPGSWPWLACFPSGWPHLWFTATPARPAGVIPGTGTSPTPAPPPPPPSPNSLQASCPVGGGDGRPFIIPMLCAFGLPIFLGADSGPLQRFFFCGRPPRLLLRPLPSLPLKTPPYPTYPLCPTQATFFFDMTGNFKKFFLVPPTFAFPSLPRLSRLVVLLFL